LIIEVKLWQVLDAPSLQDDFYLNLVDWSSQNVLAVGLGTCVYLWSASNSKVSLILLCLEQFNVELSTIRLCVTFYSAILFSGNKVV
jgi:WD40 repeat protein